MMAKGTVKRARIKTSANFSLPAQEEGKVPTIKNHDLGGTEGTSGDENWLGSVRFFRFQCLDFPVSFY